MLGFHFRSFYIYRIYCDGTIEDAKNVFRKFLVLENESSQEDCPVEYLSNFGHGWFTYEETVGALYNAVEGIGGNPSCKENDLILFQASVKFEDSGMEISSKRFYIIGHRTRDCDELGDKNFVADHTIPSNEDIGLAESLEDAVYAKLDQAVGKRNEFMPLIMDECQEALRIELTSKTPEESKTRVEAYRMEIKSYPYGVRTPGCRVVALTEWIHEKIEENNDVTAAMLIQMLNEMNGMKRAKILGGKDKPIPAYNNISSRLSREKAKIGMQSGG